MTDRQPGTPDPQPGSDDWQPEIDEDRLGLAVKLLAPAALAHETGHAGAFHGKSG
jgi:hypothetical protein